MQFPGDFDMTHNARGVPFYRIMDRLIQQIDHFFQIGAYQAGMPVHAVHNRPGSPLLDAVPARKKLVHQIRKPFRVAADVFPDTQHVVFVVFQEQL